MSFTNAQINAIEKEAREVSANTGEDINTVRKNMYKNAWTKLKALKNKPKAVISIHTSDDLLSKKIKIARIVSHKEIEEIGFKGVLLSIIEDMNKFVKEL